MRLSLATIVISAALLSTALPGATVFGDDRTGRARVDGGVTDQSGAPLVGASISVRHLARPAERHVLTDAKGCFILDGLPAGSWTMEVVAPGRPARRIGLHLPSDSSWLELADVRLARPSSPPASPSPETTLAVDETSPVATYEDVRAALVRGRVGRARRLVSSVDAGAPGDAQLLFDIGRKLLTAGETEEALTLFGRALDRDPDHADARYNRALGLLALGRPEEARRDLEAVVALGPDGALAERARLVIERLASDPSGAAPPTSSPDAEPGRAQ